MPLFDWLFNPTGLTPHGFCLSWSPGLVALHAGSDAVIGLAYFSIPLALAALLHRRPDLRYGWVVNLFVAFILACGATHLMSILTLWAPIYGVEGLIKAVTAVLSIATAVILWPLIPRLVALPSASELERRVEERTAQLSEANARLTEALDERTAAVGQRDLLLREVYHRVKNNLQIVDGLLVMQARRLEDRDSKAALAALRSRIYALGLVHEQLMGSDDLRTFDVAPFLQELSRNIIKGGPSQAVSLTVRAAPLDVGLDFAVPLGLIVTELVTNSLKHAFPGGQGTVEVTLDRSADGTVLLVVSDDGAGYDNPTLARVGRPAMGTSIIQGLVAQLKGTMTVIRGKGTRTEIRVAAPVSP